MVANSTKKKPKKPYASFPLYAHNSGQWAKKLRGRVSYFGPWADPDAALEAYHCQLAGKTPSSKEGDGLTVRKLANHFLDQKQSEVESGNITRVHWQDYCDTYRDLVALLGKGALVSELRAQDFAKLRTKWAKGYSPSRLQNNITRVRSLFKWGWEAEFLEKPVKFGPDFQGPSARAKRKARYEQGRRDLEADDILLLLEEASPQLHACILLGINAGFGNSDCAALKKTDVNLKDGWFDAARVKTYIPRRCKLWPETIEALEEVINDPAPIAGAEFEPLVFRTRFGTPYIKVKATKAGRWYKDDAIAKEFTKLRNTLELSRERCTFYDLRRTFETVASGSRDQIAVDCVMGHVDDSMAAIYRQGIEDKRLEKVADHVREWLLSK